MLIRNLSALWTTQVVTKATMFAALVMIARRLPAEDYGAIEYALGLSALAAVIIEGGMGSVGVRRLNQGAATARELAATVLTAQLLLAIVVIPAASASAWLFTDDRNAVLLSIAVLSATILLPLRQDWLFQATGRMAHIAVAQLLRVLLFSLLLLLVVRSSGQLMRVAAAEIISVAISAGYLLSVQYRSITPIGLCLSRSRIESIFRDGGAIAAAAVLWAATQYIPLMVFAHTSGMAETAYFGAAHRLAISLVTFSWLYHFNLYPLVARRIHDSATGFERLNDVSVRATSWAGVGLALGVALCAESLLAALFGEPFRRAGSALAALVWTFPVTVISGHARWALTAAGHAGDVLISQLAGLCVAALGCWLLITPFGQTGAGFSLTAGCVAVWAMAQWFARIRGVRIPVLKSFAPMLVAAALLLLATLVGWNQWVECSAGLAAFAVAALAADRRLPGDLRWLLKLDSRLPISPSDARPGR